MIDEKIFNKFNIGEELSGDDAREFISYIFAEILKEQKNKEHRFEELYKRLNKKISIKIKKID